MHARVFMGRVLFVKYIVFYVFLVMQQSTFILHILYFVSISIRCESTGEEEGAEVFAIKMKARTAVERGEKSLLCDR